MKNKNILNNTLIFITTATGLIWLGGYIARMLITFQLFDGTQFELKSLYSSVGLKIALETINPAISYNLFTFPLFILFFVIYLVFGKLSLKRNGWLFVASILILITAPFEFYLLSIDYKIVTEVFYNTQFDPNYILELTIKRFKVLSSFPMINVFTHLAVIYLFIFKPLTKSVSNEN